MRRVLRPPLWAAYPPPKRFILGGDLCHGSMLYHLTVLDFSKFLLVVERRHQGLGTTMSFVWSKSDHSWGTLLGTGVEAMLAGN